MRIIKENFNWHGLNHDAMRKRFGDLDGNLEYLGTFTVLGEYRPVAVYRAPNPDVSKGHKPFLLISIDPILMMSYVRGMDHMQIEPYRKQAGVHCTQCDDVIYSIMRHDMRWCKCRRTFVDGGREYLRSTVHGTRVEIDLLSGEALAI